MSTSAGIGTARPSPPTSRMWRCPTVDYERRRSPSPAASAAQTGRRWSRRRFCQSEGDARRPFRWRAGRAPVAERPSLARPWVTLKNFPRQSGVRRRALAHRSLTYPRTQAWSRRCYRMSSRSDLPGTDCIGIGHSSGTGRRNVPPALCRLDQRPWQHLQGCSIARRESTICGADCRPWRDGVSGAPARAKGTPPAVRADRRPWHGQGCRHVVRRELRLSRGRSSSARAASASDVCRLCAVEAGRVRTRARRQPP